MAARARTRYFDLIAEPNGALRAHPPIAASLLLFIPQSFPSGPNSICIPPSRNPPFRLLGQFDYLNIKNSSAFLNYYRMTGRQEYDRNMTGRQDDRKRILDEYMIDSDPGA